MLQRPVGLLVGGMVVLSRHALLFKYVSEDALALIALARRE
jgi:hypothetical protein